MLNSQGTSQNPDITDILKEIFWLLFAFKCSVDLRLIPTKNDLADLLTRLPILEDLRLSRRCFLSLWDRFGPLVFEFKAS